MDESKKYFGCCRCYEPCCCPCVRYITAYLGNCCGLFFLHMSKNTSGECEKTFLQIRWFFSGCFHHPSLMWYSNTSIKNRAMPASNRFRSLLCTNSQNSHSWRWKVYLGEKKKDKNKNSRCQWRAAKLTERTQATGGSKKKKRNAQRREAAFSCGQKHNSLTLRWREPGCETRAKRRESGWRGGKKGGRVTGDDGDGSGGERKWWASQGQAMCRVCARLIERQR